jgi:hypothetical protein
LLRKVVGGNWVSAFRCASARAENQFPSVLLQPLGHLSTLESTAYERSQGIIAYAGDFRDLPRITFALSEFEARESGRTWELRQTP